ncbi:hypothetical protein FB561_2201 [Kribbella amoyensis]|uniref:Uncharacterized protein n=1 Tax=Kribbella amoyensis TaxID=996641 RepID=A0A561BQF7_9ACTN|nr:hypothetical protein FB561_2201 [Kribbella amoyensis]
MPFPESPHSIAAAELRPVTAWTAAGAAGAELQPVR